MDNVFKLYCGTCNSWCGHAAGMVTDRWKRQHRGHAISLKKYTPDVRPGKGPEPVIYIRRSGKAQHGVPV
jgi:hypothetical protein